MSLPFKQLAAQLQSSPSMAMSGAVGGPTMEEVLPRLAHETELQKLLADEKMRADQHKTNYMTLKAEHTRLQDEYVELQTEMKNTIEESRLVQEKYKALLEQTRKELSAKQGEIEDMRSQSMTPQKLELLKMQLSEELEKPFRDKLHQVTEEYDACRAELNKLKYENNFLKSEYEHEKQEHEHVLEELKIRHEAEVTNLRKDKETILARTTGDSTGDHQRVRTLQRENAQLHLKVKGLLSELDEIRAQREHLGLQSDHVSRLQNKQLQEHASNIRSLETEKESLKLQVDNLQRELSSSTDLHNELTTKVHSLEKDNLILRNRADEVSHKSKVEVTNLKMQMLKERGDLERDRDRLSNQIEDLQSELEIAKHSIDSQASALVDKERELVKRVQAAREEEWQKLHRVENEKLEMETKLQEIERRKIDEESQRHIEKERLEEQMKQVQEQRETVEKEILVLKTKLQHHQSVLDQLERERNENADLKSKLHRIETQYNAYVGNEQELVDLNTKLKHQLEVAVEDLRHTRTDLDRSKLDMDKVLTQNRATWTEEKAQLQARISDLDGQLSQLHNTMTDNETTHKKKKKKYVKVNMALKNRLQLLKAKIGQLEAEREALKKAIPPENYNMVQKQFKELVRRHKEFQGVLLANVDQVPIGEMSFGSVTAPFESTMQQSQGVSFAEDKHHQRDLEMLKQRLDQLDDQQRHQMAELKGISKVITPVKAPLHHDTDDYEISSDDGKSDV